MNLPTKLTVLRMIMIPFVLFFMLPLPFAGAEGWNSFILGPGMLAALILFAAASYTDYLDGHIARKQGIVTNLGKFLDPIADKLLVLAVLIALTERGRISTIVPVIILFREFTVTGIRLIAATDGTVIAASHLGKLKTVSQIVAILVIMLEMGTHQWIGSTVFGDLLRWSGNIALAACVILTIVSGWDYLKKNLGLLRA